MDDSFEVEYRGKTYTVMFFVSSGKWKFSCGRLARKMTECGITNLLDRQNGSFSLAGNAFCGEHDKYDKITGYKIALTRALAQVPLTKDFRMKVWRAFWEWADKKSAYDFLKAEIRADDTKLSNAIRDAIGKINDFSSEMLSPSDKSLKALRECGIEIRKRKACNCDNGVCKSDIVEEIQKIDSQITRASEAFYVSRLGDLRVGDYFKFDPTSPLCVKISDNKASVVSVGGETFPVCNSQWVLHK